MKHVRLFWVLFVVMLGLDQWTKHWARTQANGTVGNDFWPVWPNVFEFTLSYNEGVAFGMLSGFGKNLWPIAVIITGICAYTNFRSHKEPNGVHIGLSLVSAGAIGNLIDRLWLGKVTDMFHFRLIDFPVFNWADTCITIGAILLVIFWAFDGLRKPEAASQASPPNEPNPNPEPMQAIEPKV